MKRIHPAVILVLLGSLAFGATQYTRILHLKVAGKTLLGTTTETNAVSHVLFGSQVAMFYTDGGLGCTLPTDAGVATITGAQTDDVCIVQMPALSHPGSKVDCTVTASNTATLRHCAEQENVDAGQLTYRIFVIGNQ